MEYSQVLGHTIIISTHLNDRAPSLGIVIENIFDWFYFFITPLNITMFPALLLRCVKFYSLSSRKTPNYRCIIQATSVDNIAVICRSTRTISSIFPLEYCHISCISYQISMWACRSLTPNNHPQKHIRDKHRRPAGFTWCYFSVGSSQ